MDLALIKFEASHIFGCEELSGGSIIWSTVVSCLLLNGEMTLVFDYDPRLWLYMNWIGTYVAMCRI